MKKSRKKELDRRKQKRRNVKKKEVLSAKNEQPSDLEKLRKILS